MLDGVVFDVWPGECLVILGRSGTGKSVTLRQLNGLETPDAGSVVFHGTDLTALSERELFPVRRHMAMLFQGGALFDSMTVFENVAFPLREHDDLDEDAIGAKVAEKLDLVGLQGIESKMPSALPAPMTLSSMTPSASSVMRIPVAARLTTLSVSRTSVPASMAMPTLTWFSVPCEDSTVFHSRMNVPPASQMPCE